MSSSLVTMNPRFSDETLLPAGKIDANSEALDVVELGAAHVLEEDHGVLERDDSSAKGTGWFFTVVHQVIALSYKNVISLRNTWVSTSLQILIPALVMVLYGIILNGANTQVFDAHPEPFLSMKSASTSESKFESLPTCNILTPAGAGAGFGRPIDNVNCLDLVFAPANDANVMEIMKHLSESNKRKLKLASDSEFTSLENFPDAEEIGRTTDILGFESTISMRKFLQRRDGYGHVYAAVSFKEGGIVNKAGYGDGSIPYDPNVDVDVPVNTIGYEIWVNRTMLAMETFDPNSYRAKIIAKNGVDRFASETGRSGISLRIQRAVNEAIIGVHTGSGAEIQLDLQRFPEVRPDTVTVDDVPASCTSFYLTIALPIELMGIVFFLSGCMIYFITMVRHVVQEKESRVLEGLRIMGLQECAYWLSFAMYFAIISLLGAALVLVAGKLASIPLFLHTDTNALFYFLWSTLVMISAWACFVSTIVPGSNTALLLGTVLFLVAVLSGVIFNASALIHPMVMYNPNVLSPPAMSTLEVFWPPLLITKVYFGMDKMTRTYTVKGNTTAGELDTLQNEKYTTNDFTNGLYSHMNTMCIPVTTLIEYNARRELDSEYPCPTYTNDTVALSNCYQYQVHSGSVRKGDITRCTNTFREYYGQSKELCEENKGVFWPLPEPANVTISYTCTDVDGCPQETITQIGECRCTYSGPSDKESVDKMWLVTFAMYVLSWYWSQTLGTFSYGKAKSMLFFLAPWWWAPSLFSRPRFLRMCRVRAKTRKLRHIDKDVIAEEEKIAGMIHQRKHGNRSAMEGIVVDGLVKDFTSWLTCGRKNKRAVDGLSMHMEPNKISVVLGSNGAGKTTTINMMLGLSNASGGDCYIDGVSTQDSDLIRSQIAACPQHDILWNDLSVQDHLKVYGLFQGIERSTLNKLIKSILDQIHLNSVASSRVSGLSGGMKRRLSVAISTMGKKRIVLLDEPTTGVDVANRKHLWEMLKRLRKNRIVLLTTHSLEEAEAIGDHVAIMSQGHLVAVGSPLHIKSRFGGVYQFKVMLHNQSDKTKLIAKIRTVAPGVLLSENEEDSTGPTLVDVPKTSRSQIPALFRLFNTEKELVKEFGVGMSSLEDAFLKLTAREEGREVKKKGKDSALTHAEELAQKLIKQNKALKREVETLLVMLEEQGIHVEKPQMLLEDVEVGAEELAEKDAKMKQQDDDDEIDGLDLLEDDKESHFSNPYDGGFFVPDNIEITTMRQARAILLKSLSLQKRQRIAMCCQMLIPLGLVIGVVVTGTILKAYLPSTSQAEEERSYGTVNIDRALCATCLYKVSYVVSDCNNGLRSEDECLEILGNNTFDLTKAVDDVDRYQLYDTNLGDYYLYDENIRKEVDGYLTGEYSLDVFDTDKNEVMKMCMTDVALSVGDFSCHQTAAVPPVDRFSQLPANWIGSETKSPITVTYNSAPSDGFGYAPLKLAVAAAPSSNSKRSVEELSSLLGSRCSGNKFRKVENYEALDNRFKHESCVFSNRYNLHGVLGMTGMTYGSTTLNSCRLKYSEVGGKAAYDSFVSELSGPFDDESLISTYPLRINEVLSPRAPDDGNYTTFDVNRNWRQSIEFCTVDDFEYADQVDTTGPIGLDDMITLAQEKVRDSETPLSGVNFGEDGWDQQTMINMYKSLFPDAALLLHDLEVGGEAEPAKLHVTLQSFFRSLRSSTYPFTSIRYTYTSRGNYEEYPSDYSSSWSNWLESSFLNRGIKLDWSGLNFNDLPSEIYSFFEYDSIKPLEEAHAAHAFLNGLSTSLLTMVTNARRKEDSSWKSPLLKGTDINDTIPISISVGIGELPNVVLNDRYVWNDSEYYWQSYYSTMSIMSQIMIGLATTIILPQLVYTLVYEKEHKLREYLTTAGGMRQSAYFAMNYLFMLCLTSSVLLLIYIIGAGGGLDMFVRNIGTSFILFVIWANVMVAMALFFSTLFKKTRLSLVLMYFFVLVIAGVASIISILVYPSTFDIMPLSLAFIPQLAYFRCIYLMSNRQEAISDPEVASLLGMLIVDYIILMILSVYLNNVLKQEFGEKKHPLYFVEDLYRFIRNPKVTTSLSKQTDNSDGSSVETAEDPSVVAEREALTVSGPDLPMSPEEAPVQIMGLRMEYNKGRKNEKTAVKNLYMHVKKGEILGLLGPNGSGKSTTISILSGSFHATGGEAYVGGINVRASRKLQRVGLCPQFDTLWPTLTVMEHLLCFARLKGVKASEEYEVAEAAAKTVRLQDSLKKKARELSGGQARRLSLAISFLGDPAVVMLDEPTTGIDSEARREIWGVIQKEKGKRSIILTSHSMEESEVLCDRVAVMTHGLLQGIGTSTSLKEKHSRGVILTVAFKPENRQRAIDFAMEFVPMAVNAEEGIDNVVFEIRKNANGVVLSKDEQGELIAEIFVHFQRNAYKHGVVDFTVRFTDLNEAFLAIAQKSEETYGMA